MKRILVANRGEIARRVIATARRMGIETVAVHSDADTDALHVREATVAFGLGGNNSAESYLRVDKLLEAARAAGADAVHPGYGFLSEDAGFAQAVQDAGLIWIGPPPAAIRALGDKAAAKALGIQQGVPCLPGYAGDDPSDARFAAEAERIGYPVMVKAVAGGGGRGMKRADTPAELGAQFELAGAEALAAFGDGRVYLECYVAKGRHVEVQVLGDGERVIHLGDRDCSVQRRYQKLVEEAPAPHLRPSMRQELHAAAVRFARHIGYRSLGTVEFLVDVERERFYFLEMNARIQVEHPVTELVTGLDLVAEQLRVAEGRAIGIRQEDVMQSGHAVECRINAEDTERDFQPSPGRVGEAHFAQGEGLRVDTHIEAGSLVPPFYDSMVAKLVAHGRTRGEALQRLDAALAELRLTGIRTNQALHRQILASAEFSVGGVDTGFLGRWLAERAGRNAAGHPA